MIAGVFPCCGYGGVNSNGTPWTTWDGTGLNGGECDFCGRPDLISAVDDQYARLLRAGKTVSLSFNGGPLPPAAFHRREEFANEILAIVLQHNLSGITL